MASLSEDITSALARAQGWCTEAKAAELSRVLQNAPLPGLSVEIGVFGGSSLLPQALTFKHRGSGKAVGIDPWSRDASLEEMIAEENKQWWGGLDHQKILEGCQNLIREFGVSEHVELLRAKSCDVVNQFAAESIDLLHIDGNHSEALSYTDATMYLPKVKPGGYVFFDDIWWSDGTSGATTRKAVMFLSQHCTRVGVVGDCVILQKD